MEEFIWVFWGSSVFSGVTKLMYVNVKPTYYREFTHR